MDKIKITLQDTLHRLQENLQKPSSPTSPIQSEICTLCGNEKPILQRCLSCENLNKEISEDIKTLGGRFPYTKFKFESFKKTPLNAKAFDNAFQFEPDQDNLFIFGPTGSGKTHLAISAARKFLRKKRISILKPMDLFREIRASQDARDELGLIRRWIKFPILVIDDLGISKDTEFSITTLYEVIDGRYMAGSGGLIVTSNLTFDDLAKKMGDDRIVSRLFEMCKRLSLVGEKDHRLFSTENENNPVRELNPLSTSHANKG